MRNTRPILALSIAVNTVLMATAKEAYPGLEVELIDLAGLKIPGELAASLPLEPGQTDDFPKVAEKLVDPRVIGILVGTPVYMGTMSAREAIHNLSLHPVSLWMHSASVGVDECACQELPNAYKDPNQ